MKARTWFYSQSFNGGIRTDPVTPARLEDRETIHCAYCGGSGDLGWFQSHTHANPFANVDDAGHRVAEDLTYCDSCNEACAEPSGNPDRAVFCCICANREIPLAWLPCPQCEKRHFAGRGK